MSGAQMMMQGRQPAGGGGSFSPEDITGGLFWLDASDTATITSSGGAVSAMEDKFNGHDFVQAVSGSRPGTGAFTQNGLNVLTFDGEDFLAYDAGSDVVDLSPMTLFAVMYDTAGSGQYRRLVSTRRSASGLDDTGAPNMIPALRGPSTNLYLRSNAVQPSAVTYSASTWTLARTRVSSTTVAVAVNGGSENTAAGTPAAGLLRYVWVGHALNSSGTPSTISSSGWIGRLAELIIYAAELTSGERTDVETYLDTKWGL